MVTYTLWHLCEHVDTLWRPLREQCQPPDPSPLRCGIPLKAFEPPRSLSSWWKRQWFVYRATSWKFNIVCITKWLPNAVENERKEQDETWHSWLSCSPVIFAVIVKWFLFYHIDVACYIVCEVKQNIQQLVVVCTEGVWALYAYQNVCNRAYRRTKKPKNVWSCRLYGSLMKSFP